MPASRIFSSIRRLGHAALSVFAAAILVGATAMLLSATASAAPGNGNGNGAEHANPGNNGKAHEVHTSPQPASNADFTGHGANTHGPYDSTRDGSPSGNGNGTGNAIGKPCAGCVGKADNKNPPGQLPGGSDANAGYECDRNHGVGRTNPAHTGCRPDSPPPPPDTCPSGNPPVNGQCDGDNPGGDNPGGGTPGGGQPPQAQPGAVPASAAGEDLAFTGAAVLPLLGLAAMTIVAGAVLMLASRRRRRPLSTD